MALIFIILNYLYMLNYILIHKIGFKIYLCSVFSKIIYINLILKSIYPYIPRLGVYLYS